MSIQMLGMQLIGMQNALLSALQNEDATPEDIESIVEHIGALLEITAKYLD